MCGFKLNFENLFWFTLTNALSKLNLAVITCKGALENICRVIKYKLNLMKLIKIIGCR